MNARDAWKETQKTLAKKLRDARQEDKLKKKQRQDQEEYERNTVFPAFMKEVYEAIRKTAARGKTWLKIDASSKVVADLAVAKLVSEEYDAHDKETYVEAEYNYGDSGEGVHGAYWQHTLHIRWGKKQGNCPACLEDLARRQW